MSRLLLFGELRLASLGWCLIGSGFVEEEVNARTQRRRDAKGEGEARSHLLGLGESSCISYQPSARTGRPSSKQCVAVDDGTGTLR